MINKKTIAIIVIAIAVLSSIGGLIYWNIVSGRVYIEKSSVSASVINLAPTVGGSLQEVFVNVGDSVKMFSPVARVGNELIKAKSDGQVLSINTNIGASFGPGQAVATMINPDDLRIIGQVQEDKGLKNIKLGQTAVFTVDAFGSKEFNGIVESVASAPDTSDIVFSISDNRQENDFDVKVKFNVSQYPELKNGMSAKLWIYK